MLVRLVFFRGALAQVLEIRCVSMGTRVPECLRGVLAMEIARRMVQEDWQYWLSEELPMDEYEEPSVDFVLAQQKLLGIKRTHVDCPVCASCGVTGTRLVKCGKCLVTYYCNGVCQQAHWQEHKSECVAPSPKVQCQYAVALPDYAVTRGYVEACKSRAAMPILIVSRECFEEVFGQQEHLKTLVELAYTGRPHPYMLNVTYKDAGRRGVYGPEILMKRVDLSGSSEAGWLL